VPKSCRKSWNRKRSAPRRAPCVAMPHGAVVRKRIKRWALTRTRFCGQHRAIGKDGLFGLARSGNRISRIASVIGNTDAAGRPCQDARLIGTEFTLTTARVRIPEAHAGGPGLGEERLIVDAHADRIAVAHRLCS